ncbi:MAG: DUF4990 domain-containing protein [Ignavibacteriales bacterium]|nr:MAG: DUF4990 domain-containing protein [Ignavibacteriales bacterium]
MKYISLLLFGVLILFFSNQSIAQIYVAVTGSDTNPGTIEQPLKTIPAAVTLAQAGDTVYVRGGVYTLSSTITISKNGTENNKYYLFAYQDERPVLDYTTQPYGSSNRGINLYGNYWHVKGIDIYGAGDNGMFVRGSNNIIEFCSFYENKDTGLQLGNGASYNNVINCDSYYNADPSQGNADGFAAKLDVGTGTYFYGCRAWQNSDDGWDGYLRGADNVTTLVENSWCFMNGYLKDGTVSTGNGNGYKMGGGDNTNSQNLANHFTIVKSLAFDNRVKGYDQNNNRGSMKIFNSSAYRNGTNYSIPGVINQGEVAAITNCAVLGSAGSLAGHVVLTTNSWLPPFNVTAADFVSLDTTGVRAARNPDGSLPLINFLNLVQGSQLIDSGTDIGLPFVGSAPDIGAFEYGEILPVELISFTAFVVSSVTTLNWTTSSELNNLGFEVQRKLDEDHFTTIGFVRGNGTTTQKNDYRFVTDFFENQKNIYRLKQLDYSGAFTYSDEIDVSKIIPSEFILYQNYPNPFNPATNFKYNISTPGKVSLIIYDVLGEQVAGVVNEYQEPGSYEVAWTALDGSGSSLPSGMYIARLQSGESVQSVKILFLK